MKRHFCFILFLFSIWSSTWADEILYEADSCASYKLLSDHIFDFGDVDINCDSISATFFIKSTGNVPMIILGGSTTCTCTLVSFSQDYVSPGDTLEVKVTYHPFVLGAFKQSATVSTNTKPYNFFRLLIKGNVIDAVPKE